MNQVNVQREEQTRKWDGPTMTAVEWMRKNKDVFKGRVFEPPRLSVFPKDEYRGKKFNFRSEEGRRLLDMIEGPISQSAFRVSSVKLEFDASNSLSCGLCLLKPLLCRRSSQTFLFEFREDYDLFMGELADKQGLRLNASELHQMIDAPMDRLLTQEQVSLSRGGPVSLEP